MRRQLTTQGYQEIDARGHPLVWANGASTEHRVTLYSKIGPGPHPCYWCGLLVYWEGPRGRSKLNVDHLDDDRANNEPENLVPSCMRCNIRRGRKSGRRQGDPGVWKSHCKYGHALVEGNLYWTGGRRRCKTCTNEYQRARYKESETLQM